MIEKIINEYLNITGRPAATLSVAEFLEIKKYAQKSQISLSQLNTADRQDKADISLPAKNTADIHPIHSPHKTEKAKEPVVTVKKEAYKEPSDKKNTIEKKNSSALAMLQSVSG